MTGKKIIQNIASQWIKNATNAEIENLKEIQEKKHHIKFALELWDPCTCIDGETWNSCPSKSELANIMISLANDIDWELVHSMNLEFSIQVSDKKDEEDEEDEEFEEYETLDGSISVISVLAIKEILSQFE